MDGVVKVSVPNIWEDKSVDYVVDSLVTMNERIDIQRDERLKQLIEITYVDSDVLSEIEVHPDRINLYVMNDVSDPEVMNELSERIKDLTAGLDLQTKSVVYVTCSNPEGNELNTKQLLDYFIEHLHRLSRPRISVVGGLASLASEYRHLIRRNIYDSPWREGNPKRENPFIGKEAHRRNKKGRT